MARGDRSVDVFVRKLRQKLEKASPDWRYIHTHFGVGYRFAAEPVDGSEAAARIEAAELAEPADAPAPATARLDAAAAAVEVAERATLGA
jgi:DNA-binding winged helix-turn-helix (wHTH) protein